MKRRTLGLVLSAILAVSVSACGAQKETAAESAAPVEEETADPYELSGGDVELTVWAEKDDFEMMEQMIESFKAEYGDQANFTINLEEHMDAGMKNEVLGNVHAGYDLFSFPDDQFDGMMAAGLLSPVPNSQDISSANVEGAVAAATYQDTMYAYPYTADNGYFLYYNKKYFKDSDVETLDQIMRICEKNNKKFEMEFTSGWYLYTFFGQTGLDFGINEDGVTNHCNWNATDTPVKGTDIAQSILDFTASKAFLAAGDTELPENMKKDVICGISGTWNATAIEQALGSDYGAVKLPTFTCAGQQIQMSSFTGYKMFGVSKYSEELGWAHKLADWFTNEQNQIIRFEQRSQGPSNINAGSSDAIMANPAIAAVIEQSQYGNLQRVGSKFWDPCTQFANVMMAGNPNGTDLQELMDTLVTGITASTAD